MKYITSYYIPPLAKKENIGLRRKYFFNAMGAFENKEVLLRLPIMIKNQEILGKDLIVFVESELKTHPIGKQIYKSFLDNQLNLVELPKHLIKQGLFWKKNDVVLQAMEMLNEPVLWMDFTDSIVKEKLNKNEVEFLENGREVVAEWECRRRLGKCPHYKNGNENQNIFVNTTQNGIYFIRSIDFMKEVIDFSIKNRIACDQLAFTHIIEKRFGLFQDSSKEEMIKISSYGLFTSCNINNNQSVYLFRDHYTYKPKIFHKCI